MFKTVVKTFPRCLRHGLVVNSSNAPVRFNQTSFSSRLYNSCKHASLFRLSQNDHHMKRQSFSTQADHELIEFLADEINQEKKSEGPKLQNIQDYTLEKSDGCEVTFMRQFNGEVIRVSFNVNDSIEEEFDDDSKDQSNAPEFKSKPAFTVQLNRGGDKSLFIHCNFPESMESEPHDQSEESYEDLIEIVDVKISNLEEDINSVDYRLHGHVMDPNMYDILMGIMEERGINSNFIEDLVQYSTAYEHKMYTNLLESMKDFFAPK